MKLPTCTNTKRHRTYQNYDSWFEQSKGIPKDTSEELISKGKKFMKNCYATKPEDYCLKTLFDAAFFWN